MVYSVLSKLILHYNNVNNCIHKQDDYYGKTALMYACTRGMLSIVKLLLYKYNAIESIHLQDKRGYNVLMCSVEENNDIIVKLLLSFIRFNHYFIYNIITM